MVPEFPFCIVRYIVVASSLLPPQGGINGVNFFVMVLVIMRVTGAGQK